LPLTLLTSDFRELNKVYTNGTLVDAELLTDDQAGHCISIREEKCADGSDATNSFGICVLDCSTSQFNLSAFEDDVCRTKLETLMRQLRPKELLFTKVELGLYFHLGNDSSIGSQGTLSVSTTRLLKAILPAACLWTGLRVVEGFEYDKTVQELNELYPAGDADDMDDEGLLNVNVPKPIRDMVQFKCAIEALGSTIWYELILCGTLTIPTYRIRYLRQLNIDKDILSMKNFNVYDPMKKGQGLVLDGQTLAHIEV